MLKAKLTEYDSELIEEIAKGLAALNLAEVVHRTDRTAKKFSAWAVDHRHAMHDMGLRWDNGATKMVFMHEELGDWVIKVPFLFGDKTTVGALHLNDYCRAEADIYADAVRFEVAEYLAPTYFYGEFGGIPFYIQRRVECLECENTDVFYDFCSNSVSREDYDSEDEYYEAVENEVEYMEDVDRLSAIFGKWIQALIDFLDERGISDFHAANFGYLSHRPVLIDYSGY